MAIGQTISADEFKKRYNTQSNSFPTEEPSNLKQSFSQKLLNIATFGATSEYGKGVLKGAGSTVSNLATLGQKGLEGITGKKIIPTTNEVFGEKLKPTNTAQKVGFGVEQAAEFFVPGMAGVKTAKGAGVLARAGTSALESGLVTAAQGGNVKQAATNAAIGGGIPLIGKAVDIATKPVKKLLSEKIAPALLNKYILRPVAKDFHFGKDPGLGVAKEGLKANTREGLLKQITAKKKQIGDEIDKILTAPEIAKKKIDITPAIATIDESIQKAAESGEEVLYSRLVKIREGITSKFKIIDGKAVKVADREVVLAPKQVAQLKREIGKLSKWTGQAFDAEANQARVKIYRALNDLVDASAPGSKVLNARYANLLTAEKSLDNTINVAKRQSPVGLVNAGLGTAYAGYSALSGDSTPEAIAKGLLFTTAVKTSQSTAMVSRLSKQLAKFSPEERTVIAKSVPLLRNLIFGSKSAKEKSKNKPQ